MPKIPNLPERTGLTGDENVIIETGGIVQRGRLVPHKVEELGLRGSLNSSE